MYLNKNIKGLSNAQNDALKELFDQKLQDLEDEKKHRKEMVKLELLITATSPASIESIYKSTTPDKDENIEAYYRHIEEMQNAVEEAVRAEASSMNLKELKDYASRYSGLSSLLSDRHEAIKTLGLGLEESSSLSGHRISQLQHEKNLNIRSIETSSETDFGLVNLKDLSFQNLKQFRNTIDWFESLELA